MGVPKTGNVGPAVRQLRRQRGLSQRELAEAAGVSKSTVTLLEADKGNTTLESLLKIADALEAEVVLTPAPSVILRRGAL